MEPLDLVAGHAFPDNGDGQAARGVGTKAGESLRLLVESAGPAPATTRMAVEDLTSRALWEKLRTSIAGQTLRHTFGPSSLAGGAVYEVRVTLSVHPAGGVRPVGQCQLWYRFGAGLPRGRRVEGGGLVGW